MKSERELDPAEPFVVAFIVFAGMAMISAIQYLRRIKHWVSER